MEQANSSADFLELLISPAFLVHNGIITKANHAAQQYQIHVGDPVKPLISIGADEYSSYTSGKLCLTLLIDGAERAAYVTIINSEHLFSLDSAYEAAEFRAFALAAQFLREPLSTAITSTDKLLQDETIQQQDSDNLTLKINRSLHQMLRALSNMSDAKPGKKASTGSKQLQDAVWVFDEALEKAANLCERSGKKLEYSIPPISANCMLDRQQLERAVFNIISNALKYSPENSCIHANLSYRSEKLYFCVENHVSAANASMQPDYFFHFLREPTISDGNSGIGLGMQIVQNAAASHGGTVLLEHTANGTFKLTMTISTKHAEGTSLNSPIRLPVDYTGGYDHAIIELSDILPFSSFDGKA